jgi:ribosomal protein S3
MAIAASMRMNAEGIKVLISGRLNGAEMDVQKVSKKEEFLYQLSEPILIMH